MLNLMKLEWKKHQLERYSITFFICVISIFGFAVLLALDTKSSIEGPMRSFNEFMSLVTILTNITFIIFGSIILSRLVISEFRMKTIHVMFTYPINRKKLLFAKLILAFLFTAGSLLLATWLIQIATYFVQPSLELFEGSLTAQDLLATIPNTITNAFMMGAIALIPLFFGMRKKSTATTITSATIISILINGTVSSGSETFNLGENIIIPLVLALLGLGVAYLSFRTINETDVA